MKFSDINNIVIPNGTVQKIEYNNEILWKSYTNVIPLSINTDGSIYSDDGWSAGYRLSSSGVEKALTAAALSGYIPVNFNDVIRVYLPLQDGHEYSSFNFFDENFGWLGQQTAKPTKYGICTAADYSFSTVNGVTEFTLNQSNATSVKYIRICHNIQVTGTGNNNITKNFIVTINETIL